MRCKYEFWACMFLAVAAITFEHQVAASIYFVAAMYFSAHHKDTDHD